MTVICSNGKCPFNKINNTMQKIPICHAGNTIIDTNGRCITKKIKGVK